MLSLPAFEYKIVQQIDVGPLQVPAKMELPYSQKYSSFLMLSMFGNGPVHLTICKEADGNSIRAAKEYAPNVPLGQFVCTRASHYGSLTG